MQDGVQVCCRGPTVSMEGTGHGLPWLHCWHACSGAWIWPQGFCEVCGLTHTYTHVEGDLKSEQITGSPTVGARMWLQWVLALVNLETWILHPRV